MKHARFALACLIAVFAISSPAQTFTITDLGNLGGTYTQANGIGAFGVIVGQAETAGDEYHAFLYSGRTITDLGAFGGVQSSAVAINNASQVAGYYYDH